VVTEKIEIERLPPFMGLLQRLRTTTVVSPPSQKSPQTSALNFS
jgi:hypothetical protein